MGCDRQVPQKNKDNGDKKVSQSCDQDILTDEQVITSATSSTALSDTEEDDEKTDSKGQMQERHHASLTLKSYSSHLN